MRRGRRLFRIVGFNPTLVRLRRLPPRCLLRAPPSFQSHAGSIEAPGTGRSRHRTASLFQSHAGSIEAVLVRVLMAVLDMFQSHAGSIEATMEVCNECAYTSVSIPRWFD